MAVAVARRGLRVRVDHDGAGDLLAVAALAGKLEDDEASERLCGVEAASEGGKLGADLDGGRDDVLGVLGAGGLDGLGVFERVVFGGVIRLRG